MRPLLLCVSKDKPCPKRDWLGRCVVLERTA